MIYIALGSNIGNRLANLRKAVKFLKSDILSNSFESIVIETKALLPTDAPSRWDKPHLNMLIAGETSLSPESLLQRLKSIEHQMGRDLDAPRWSPRIIDLDILIYNDQTINLGNLKIPHTELLNRDFLLHLLAMMPEKYLPNLQVGGKFVRADEYAYKNVNCDDLFSKSFTLGSCVMGILNITQDSFSDGGKNFLPEDAIKNAYQMVRDGAEIIDIGAQSTRPDALEIIGAEGEYKRLSPVLDGIKQIDAEVSIDSYHKDLILRLLNEHQIDWINDVTGNLDDETLKDIASSGAKILTMHSLSVPPSKDNILPHDLAMISSLASWVKNMMEKMLRCGFNSEDVVIDLGIGFGKSIYQNLSLIREIKKFRKLGCKILVGHSRKSFMKGFSSIETTGRDVETIAISCNLSKQNVDFIRVHNLQDHYRFLVADKVCSS